MEIREILIVVMYLALGPLLAISDGGLEKDFWLRNQTLEPITEVTSLDICRRKVGLYHYCRHHVIKDDYDVTHRYRFLTQTPPQKVQYLRSPITNEITTNTGIKYFWNRVFIVALASMIGIFMAIYEVSKHISFKRPSSPISADIPSPSNRNIPNRDAQNGFGKRNRFGGQ